MKNIFIALMFLTSTACQGTQTQKDTDANSQTIETESATAATTDSTDADEAQFPTEVEDDMADIPVGGLNAIRFEGWTDKDWLDNDYIREIRKFFNAYSRGDITNERFADLMPYKSLMKSKFVVVDIQPFIAGGVFMQIVFLDNPKFLFTSWVYGIVADEDNLSKAKGVVGYDVRLCKMDADDCPLTKENILEIIKEHPENKLW